MIQLNDRNRIKRIDWYKGITIYNVLRETGAAYHFNAQTYVGLDIIVMVNGVIVPMERYADFTIPDEAQLTLLQKQKGN